MGDEKIEVVVSVRYKDVILSETVEVNPIILEYKHERLRFLHPIFIKYADKLNKEFISSYLKSNDTK